MSDLLEAYELEQQEEEKARLGYVYIFSNPSYDGELKIGYTAKQTPEFRANQLYTTGVIHPFKVEYFVVCEFPKQKEDIIHTALKHCRVTGRREYFRIGLEEAKEVVTKLALSQEVIEVVEKEAKQECEGLKAKYQDLEGWLATAEEDRDDAMEREEKATREVKRLNDIVIELEAEEMAGNYNFISNRCIELEFEATLLNDIAASEIEAAKTWQALAGTAESARDNLHLELEERDKTIIGLRNDIRPLELFKNEYDHYLGKSYGNDPKEIGERIRTMTLNCYNYKRDMEAAQIELAQVKKHPLKQWWKGE